ncbi:MAG: transglutaminase-like domain-containing protein [Melioribacteraceae bacterium]|nr:transglutaminase-like domain-containing protein [Melioribacteraceae bacterium]
MNFNRTIDWEFGFSSASIMSSPQANNIQLASIGKRMGSHYIYARYTPGFQKSFSLNTDTLVTISDSVNVLNALLNYSEIFGVGYSFQFSNSFSVGATFRYFEESYAEDNVYFYFSDSINSIVTITDLWEKTHWRGDVGLTYQPFENLLLSLSSVNLFILNQKGEFNENNDLELKTKKGAILGIDYRPFNNLFLHANYESTTSFIVGSDFKFDMFGGDLAFGVSIFHDKYQTPFITGVQPSISFAYKSLNINISAIYYSEKRDRVMNVQNLLSDGIHNITNNQFSYNKIAATINLALNFKRKQKLKLLDVNILNPIYPILSEEYLEHPFAIGKVVNLSDDEIVIKPSSYILNINDDVVSSPSISIAPLDTISVPFYTVISRDFSNLDKREIAQANFYLTSIYDDNDDERQKPILINGRNSWDSKVNNLRYFVKYDYIGANKYSKKILNSNRDSLSTIDERLTVFYQTKIIFNYFIKKMQYVSDPRSSTEYVQFPTQTIEVAGGDCDDLSVAFSALLESIGIQTAFVDYRSEENISHVNLLVNTKLKPEEAMLITQNDKKYFIRKNVVGGEEIWIPIELTSLTNFKTAWEIAAQKFNSEAIDGLGLAKGRVVIYDIY